MHDEFEHFSNCSISFLWSLFKRNEEKKRFFLFFIRCIKLNPIGLVIKQFSWKNGRDGERGYLFVRLISRAMYSFVIYAYIWSRCWQLLLCIILCSTYSSCLVHTQYLKSRKCSADVKSKNRKHKMTKTEKISHF